MNWVEALKAWNSKKGGKYTVPKKGTKEHEKVMKLMKGGSILSGATMPSTYKKKGGSMSKKKGGSMDKKKGSSMSKKKGGSMSKMTVMGGIPQYTEHTGRMSGGGLKTELQVIAGKPQLAQVRGKGLYRVGASDPKLYGLKMFGQ